MSSDGHVLAVLNLILICEPVGFG